MVDEKETKDIFRDELKAYFRMISVHDPYLGNELVDVLDAYLDAKFKREWQGLTDEEIETEQLGLMRKNQHGYIALARAIEAKLKEKNT